VSTEAGFDLDRASCVDDRVAVRPEPFGALLYHFGARRLSFLKNTTVLAVVRVAGRASERAIGLRGGGGRPGGAARLRPGPGHFGRLAHDPRTARARREGVMSLVEQFEGGVDAPICRTA
jgi:putative mycofactocin binding protein MftB